MHALESAKPVKLRMPGMQEFAAAVSWGFFESPRNLGWLHILVALTLQQQTILFVSAQHESIFKPGQRILFSPCSTG